MGTTIRPSVSESNKYWISKERYYELKHFCLQYNDWLKIYNELDDSRFGLDTTKMRCLTNIPGNPTEKIAIAKIHYKERMDMIHEASKICDDDIAEWVFKAVTEDVSCSSLITKHNMPCGKDKFYMAYRRFFWYLSKYRD